MLILRQEQEQEQGPHRKKIKSSALPSMYTGRSSDLILKFLNPSVDLQYFSSCKVESVQCWKEIQSLPKITCLTENLPISTYWTFALKLTKSYIWQHWNTLQSTKLFYIKHRWTVDFGHNHLLGAVNDITFEVNLLEQYSQTDSIDRVMSWEDVVNAFTWHLGYVGTLGTLMVACHFMYCPMWVSGTLLFVHTRRIKVRPMEDTRHCHSA